MVSQLCTAIINAHASAQKHLHTIYCWTAQFLAKQDLAVAHQTPCLKKCCTSAVKPANVAALTISWQPHCTSPTPTLEPACLAP